MTASVGVRREEKTQCTLDVTSMVVSEGQGPLNTPPAAAESTLPEPGSIDLGKLGYKSLLKASLISPRLAFFILPPSDIKRCN